MSTDTSAATEHESGWALACSARHHEWTDARRTNVVGLAGSTELGCARVAVAVEESRLGWTGAQAFHNSIGGVGTLAHSRGGDDETVLTKVAHVVGAALGAVLDCTGNTGLLILG